MVCQQSKETNLQAGCKSEQVSLLNSHEKEREFRWISVNINSKYILVSPFSLLVEYIALTSSHISHGLFALRVSTNLREHASAQCLLFVFSRFCATTKAQCLRADLIAIKFSHPSVVSVKTWLCGKISDGVTETAYAAQCGALRRVRSSVQQFWYPHI